MPYPGYGLVYFANISENNLQRDRTKLIPANERMKYKNKKGQYLLSESNGSGRQGCVQRASGKNLERRKEGGKNIRPSRKRFPCNSGTIYCIS